MTAQKNLSQQQPPSIPKVSCIVTVYNGADYIKDCIDGLVAQDYPNKDVWIYNDCSTDRTGDIVQSLGETFFDYQPPDRIEDISYFRSFIYRNTSVYYLEGKSNSGPSKGRNIAIANAVKNGSHLFLMADADDVAYPTKISTLIKPILLDPERVAISYGDYFIQNSNGVIKYESKPAYDYQIFFSGQCHIHSGSLVNGLAIKPFMPTFYPEDQRVCEDYAAWLKILRSTQWLAINTSLPLTMVRSHTNDSTSTVSKEIWARDFQKAMQYR